jgi:hypothetical protein
MIDRALRSQVVINALDSKGLAVGLQESDVSTGYTTMDLHLLSARRDFMLTRERMAASVLAQAAEGTGGEFFHNHNDLNLGIRRAATQPEVYCLLAFVPQESETGWAISFAEGFFKGETPGDYAAGATWILCSEEGRGREK